MFHKCNVRDCASSAKSFVIVFDDRSDVLEKTMKVTHDVVYQRKMVCQ